MLSSLSCLYISLSSNIAILSSDASALYFSINFLFPGIDTPFFDISTLSPSIGALFFNTSTLFSSTYLFLGAGLSLGISILSPSSYPSSCIDLFLGINVTNILFLSFTIPFACIIFPTSFFLLSALFATFFCILKLAFIWYMLFLNSNFLLFLFVTIFLMQNKSKVKDWLKTILSNFSNSAKPQLTIPVINKKKLFNKTFIIRSFTRSYV